MDPVHGLGPRRGSMDQGSMFCTFPAHLRSHSLKNIGKETSIYKSEGNFSHIRKLLMTCVILA